MLPSDVALVLHWPVPLFIGLIAALVSILPSLPHQPAPGTTLAWIAGLALLTTACATLSEWIAYRSVGRSDTPV